MNNSTLYRIASAITVCSSLLFTPIASASHHNELSPVDNPNAPTSMTFAGDRVDFDRVDMYERLDRELTSIAYTHGNTLLMIKRANRFFPIMAPILKANGVPLDMLYLACVESTLNIRAYSSAKAAGLWQFMASTAKQYGLEVTDYVDERYNIEKATEAACRYLKSAYARYGNWESVAASYNGGMTRISTELDKQQVNSAYDLYLVEETTRYPFRIMATKLIMEDPKAYGYRLTAEQLYQPIEYTEVTVSEPVEDWPTWVQEYGITFAQLREANPWIRAKSLPNPDGKSYTVKIPVTSSLYRSKHAIKVYNHNWITE